LKPFTPSSSPDQPALTGRAWHYRLLWLIALSSLLMNITLVAGLLNYRVRLQASADTFAAALETIDLREIEVAVTIDETLPISMTIPFSDTFQVPIQTTIPVATTILFEDVVQVPINTTIPINTDFVVQVDIPFFGRTGIPIPIVTTIPVNLTVDVPISRLIPIETEIDVDMFIAVPVQSQIPIQTEVPVQLDFPVIISLEQLGLEAIVDQLGHALRDLTGSTTR
jgi:hypothetical protein